MSTPGIQMREHVASVSVANSVPYKCWPIRMLTCRHKPSLILEASEQVFSTWPTTMPHVWTATALGSLPSSYSISTGSFSPTTGIHAHLQIWWPQTTLSRQYISGMMTWLDLASSLALCAFTCRVLNYSISSPPQLAPNAIIKYTIGLKSVERTH